MRNYNNWDSLPVTLDMADACILLKECSQTVRRRIREGELPAKKAGRKWLFSKNDVRNYIEGGAQA